jgi:DNA invertase Pin-like site-specific DNA recombinase
MGVEVFFEKENIYSFDSKMELVLSLLSSIAQEESRNISENAKWGLKKRMRDGKVIVNCNRFMGYDKNENGQLVINAQEAKVVERIFREYVEGKGVAAIGKGLGRDKIPTVSGKYKWYDSVVRRMPRNEECYGKLLLQKTVTPDYMTKYRAVKNYHTEQYRVDNNHEPFISKQLF